MATIVLKLGGSILTNKSGSRPAVDAGNLGRIAGEVASSVRQGNLKLVVVHGAGSFGHPLASAYKLAEGLSRRNAVAMAKCQAQMNELNSIVCGKLADDGVAAFPFQVSAGSVSEGRVLKSINSGLLRKLLGKGFVPVLYGTPAYDDRQGCSIISGDQIVARLALLLHPSRVVFATNVDGIYDSNPDNNPEARVLGKLAASELHGIGAGGSSHMDVTGGMAGKLRWIGEMHGLKCQIVNGNVRGNIRKTLLGDESIGTVVRV